MPRPKIAVIGAGLIGQKHAELVFEAGFLSAIVDPSANAAAVAQKFGCPYFESIEACLAAEALDGAIVATPNHLHVPVAEVLVAHGIASLIEKPIAATASEATALANYAKAEGVPILVGHHRRHNPLIQAAKSVIDSGQLGRINLIDAKFWLYKPDDYFQQTWRTQTGAGPIFINLIHDIDLLRYLCGEIIDVQAKQSRRARGHDVEDTAVVLLEFESGALGTVSVSDTTVAPWSWEFTAAENPAYPNHRGPAYMIGGTEASLSIPDLKLWQHTGAKSWWEPISFSEVEYTGDDALKRQLAHFTQVMAGECEPIVTAETAIKSLQVIETIIEASAPSRQTALPGAAV